ncbi:MAG: class II fructose-bisphosphatase [candidate division NC10 bacterium]|nr:class II fructose-bisphosphatase [candidate division NC10 bacterium]
MERNLALEVVRVTEAAALSSARWMGRGNDRLAEQTALDAMRRAFDAVDFTGTVVIGRGEKGETPTLFVGEQVGSGAGPELDVAAEPLEGASIVAQGRANALAAVALAEKGCLFPAPEVYMEKIAVGPKALGAIDITAGPEANLRSIAETMKCYVEDLTVIILDRPRHRDLIMTVQEVGARIKLIQDGDLSAAIATSLENSGVDVLMGIGRAPEGVLAAAALRCLGGDMQAQFKPASDEDVERIRQAGVKEIQEVLTITDLARGREVMFTTTGVTDGDFLKGVRFFGGGAKTHSLLMRAKSGTVRFIDAIHRFDRNPIY